MNNCMYVASPSHPKAPCVSKQETVHKFLLLIKDTIWVLSGKDSWNISDAKEQEL